MNEEIVNFIKSLYGSENFIPLHEPTFSDLEKKYVNEAIDSTFVSSVGKFVDQFEQDFAKFIDVPYAVAVVNGTAALHISLLLSGVEPEDEVLTQALTFVATCNAISYCGAKPIFIDVDPDTMGLSPSALKKFLVENTKVVDDRCINKTTGKVIRACVPMHSFGQPCRIQEIVEICHEYKISVVEDAAESLGSYRHGQHTGTFGQFGAFSFNGNKVMTTGGGGMIVTANQELALRAKHITTTAKIPHKWNFVHDEVAYNYRMPNLNAALGCGQLERLPEILKIKKSLAAEYRQFFKSTNDVDFIDEIEGSQANFWLNALSFKTTEQRDSFLEFANDAGVMSRPAWQLMNELRMFKDCQVFGDLTNSQKISETLANIPSSAKIL
jgi:perosamine synthetase